MQEDKLRTTIRNSIHQLKTQELSDYPRKNGRGSHWGSHLLLDCSGCNHRMDDEASVTAFLRDLVKALKMKPLTEPVVVRVRGEQGRGVSGFIMITTSHCAAHFDDEEMRGFIDVFSCAPFKPQTVINLVQRYFQPKHIADEFITRDAGP